MAKTRQQKEEALQALKDSLARSKGTVFARYMGLTVEQIQELRSNLREQDSELFVAKKTLLKLMLEDAGLPKESIDDMDSGVAVVFGYEDEVAPAKIVAEFAKDHDIVEFYAGILEGEIIDTEKVNALSQLPSKQELLAKMVGSMKSPLSGLANVLGGNTRGLVQVLNQIRVEKEEQKQ